MFGYISPYRKTLSEESQKQYRTDYCGLCRALKAQYGFRACFLVSYDMTFLYALLSSTQPAQASNRCRCSAHPMCKRECTQCSEALRFCADVTMILSWWKLRDTVSDDGFFRRNSAKLLLRLYRKSYNTAAQAQPALAAQAQDRIAQLAALEKENCAELDRVADMFAQLLTACVPDSDKPEARIFRQILYHTGRYLYLIDALDDFPKDQKKNAYNPLRFRYGETAEHLSDEHRQEVLETIFCSVREIEKALRLLTPESHAELLENIISYGMPIVARGVAAGVFRKKANRRKL